MSALEDLIYGNRGTLESTPTTKEYKALFSVVADNNEKMRELLASSPDLLAHFDSTIDSIVQADAQLGVDYFAEGLRFGILLGIDIAD